jgi:hypothetical protein
MTANVAEVELTDVVDNVVDLTAWAEPTRRLVALCQQALELFAQPDARSNPHLGQLTAALDVVLTDLQTLPPLPGALGRAVLIIGSIHQHSNRDVLNALGTLARLSTIATKPTTQQRTEPAGRSAMANEPVAGPEPKRGRTRSRRTRSNDARQLCDSPTLPGFEPERKS